MGQGRQGMVVSWLGGHGCATGVARSGTHPLPRPWPPQAAPLPHRWLPSNLRGRRQDLIWPKGVNRPMMSLRVACRGKGGEGRGRGGVWERVSRGHTPRQAPRRPAGAGNESFRRQRRSLQAAQPALHNNKMCLGAWQPTSKATLRTTILLVSGSAGLPPALRLPPAAAAAAAAARAGRAAGSVVEPRHCHRIALADPNPTCLA